MARIRTVKPEYWASEQVMNCSREARLLFIGLWNFADDSGRLVDSARTLKAQVFPGDSDIDSTHVRGWLDELSTNGLIKSYEVDGKAFLYVTGWKHQKIDRPQPSKHPEPHIADHSTNARRPLATDPTLPNPILKELRRAGSLASPQAAREPAFASGSELTARFTKARSS